MALFSSGAAERQELKIADQDFNQLRDFIYEQSGIYIADNRKYLLENRLAGRLKALNLKDFGEYYYFLRFDPNKRNELSKLFEVVTTNETSFWRNPPQLKVFQENVLVPVLDELRKAKSKKMHIWSAGCSTGEEPYTLAMIIHEVLGSDLNTWSIRITANDLSEAVLRSAREAVYTDYALRTTPKEIVAKYFSAEAGKFRVKPEVKKLVSFGQINLNDRVAIKRVERSQVVFCRNVIIYFDDAMKKRVISSFYDNLLPGGNLLIGHSESLHNISRAFKPVHHPGAIIYKKE